VFAVVKGVGPFNFSLKLVTVRIKNI
jgi:hypothetical protein